MKINKINDSFVQVSGPFNQNEDIIAIIRRNHNPNFLFVKQIGIQAEPGHKVSIDGKVVEIGKTKVIQYNNVQIRTLLFLQREGEQVFVDCILE